MGAYSYCFKITQLNYKMAFLRYTDKGELHMYKHKRIFSYNADINKTAYLNWRMDSGTRQSNLVPFAEGYALAAQKLIEGVLKNNRTKDADILAFPILFSINQMIELYLKAIIWELEILNEGNIHKHTTHDIKSLLELMTAKIKKRENKSSGLEKHLVAVRNYIEELYPYITGTDANKASKLNIDFARYPFSADLSPHFYVMTMENVVVNLENLLYCLISMQESLDSLYCKYEEEISLKDENYD